MFTGIGPCETVSSNTVCLCRTRSNECFSAAVYFVKLCGNGGSITCGSYLLGEVELLDVLFVFYSQSSDLSVIGFSRKIECLGIGVSSSRFCFCPAAVVVFLNEDTVNIFLIPGLFNAVVAEREEIDDIYA